ncbi:MAG TPA: hypothetical protein VK425_10750 [Acidimicrobiales bacterium]|nr:hypothetical protein [Acidimicrobiales bacterium]
MKIAGKVAGDLGHPWALGVGGGAEQMDDTSLELDHEQHVVAAEKDGVDGKEVRRHDAFGLGTRELGPGWARTPRCWREAMAPRTLATLPLGTVTPSFLGHKS